MTYLSLLEGIGGLFPHQGRLLDLRALYTIWGLPSVPTWGFPTPAGGDGTILVLECWFLPGLLKKLHPAVFPAPPPPIYFSNI